MDYEYPDEVVKKYMSECKALLFPGLEDFGIVPVEAQACGRPVIAYGKGRSTRFCNRWKNRSVL